MLTRPPAPQYVEGDELRLDMSALMAAYGVVAKDPAPVVP